MSSSRSDHVALEDLELFAVVAEELHFGRAAVRLHISQPGLSYRIRRLESALGYEVLARTRRSVRLTAAGEVLLEGAQRVLGETRRIVGDGARVARGELATVRVGFVATALYSMLPALLRLTRERHPDLRLLLEERKTAAQVRALQLGQLDLGLLHLPLDPGTGLESVAVLEEPVGVALPHDHPLAESEELTLAELAVVNVLSLLSLASMPPMVGYSASKAAAHSMTQAIRPGLRARGIVVHGVYPGGIDTDMLAGFDVPKAPPADVAGGILDGIADGLEDIFPDPTSEQMSATWLSDPKAFERAFSREE